MSSTTFAALLAQAEEAGVGYFEPTPGNYNLVIKSANMSATKAGDPKIGLQLGIVGGPDNNKSFWTNFNFIGTNTTGLAISFRDLRSLGMGKEDFLALPDDREAASAKLKDLLGGKTFTCDIEVKESGDFTNINLRRIKLGGASAAPSVAPAAAPPSPEIPFPAADAPPF